MDPFARKMIRGAMAYAGAMLVMFAIATVVYVHLRPRCPDRVVGSATSPDNQWTATILERRCGAEAPFITHANLRRSTQPLSRGFFSGQANEGDVFVVEQDSAGAGLTMHWTAAGQLTIACSRCDTAFLRRADAQLGPVSILYDIPRR
ncbi:MAG TPA: hypothetical protein VFL42_10090 [Terriglobales bacterium]|nr:hypothetical protein [Terriglobales bacterium]